MDKKFDCYTCRYKGSVPGDRHICCQHPSLGNIVNNPLWNIVSTNIKPNKTYPLILNNMELNIKGDPHGIKMGWFMFPFCFDPIWLKNCDGYIKA